MGNRMAFTKTTLSVIESCASDVGKQAEEEFNIKLFNSCLIVEILSPIEQVLWCGLRLILRLNYLDAVNPEDAILFIGSQCEIGRYRVDFCITNARNQKRVVVECDSQEFHDRSEKERRYEKMRDRFLQKEGYTVFRYTGKEILNNYRNIAREIVGFCLDETDLTTDPNT